MFRKQYSNSQTRVGLWSKEAWVGASPSVHYPDSSILMAVLGVAPVLVAATAVGCALEGWTSWSSAADGTAVVTICRLEDWLLLATSEPL